MMEALEFAWAMMGWLVYLCVGAAVVWWVFAKGYRGILRYWRE